MAPARRTRFITARRITGVFSGVATTALCLSVAWTAFGGVVRTPTSTMRVVGLAAPHGAGRSSPQSHPLSRHPHRGRPQFSAKLDAPPIGRLAEKGTAGQAAAGAIAAAGAGAVPATSMALAGDVPNSSLLKTHSKCSRTRGRPDAA